MPTVRRLGLFAGILAALVLAGCDVYVPIFHEDPTTLREDRSEEAQLEDDRIRGDILAEFVEQDAGTLKNVTVDVYEGKVLLVGTVAGTEAQAKAEAAAATVKGVVAVVNATQVMKDSSLRDKTQDLSIENQLKKDLRKAREINSFNLRWHCVNGVVYMFGRATSAEERDKALAIARSVKRVREVVDHIAVRPLAGGHSWLNDLM